MTALPQLRTLRCEYRQMVEIRDATPADAHALATVQVASWRAAYRTLLPGEVLAGLSVPELEQVWSARLTPRPPRTGVMVATAGRRVVGFASTGPPIDPADRADPTSGDLYTLYLDPEQWGHGLGALLHAAALKHLVADGFTQAGLWVLDGNQRALRFYLHHGWIATGRTRIDSGPGNIDLSERRLRRNLTDVMSSSG